METLSKGEALSVLKLAGWRFISMSGGFVKGYRPNASVWNVRERGWRSSLEDAWWKQYQTKIQVKV